MQALLAFQGSFQGASEIVIVGNHEIQVDEWLRMASVESSAF